MIDVERDYISDMRKAIDYETDREPDGYLPRQMADRVIERLRKEDPELLTGWLNVQAAYFITRMINDRDRSIRASTRHRDRSLAYRTALSESVGRNDDAPLLRFLDMPLTVEDGTHQPLGRCNQADLTFAAGTYREREAQNRMMAMLLEKLAEKLGDRRVEDVYTEAQLAAIFGSFKPQS